MAEQKKTDSSWVEIGITVVILGLIAWIFFGESMCDAIKRKFP